MQKCLDDARFIDGYDGPEIVFQLPSGDGGVTSRGILAQTYNGAPLMHVHVSLAAMDVLCFSACQILCLRYK